VKYVPVRAESELRVGMVVLVERCRVCHKAHQHVSLGDVDGWWVTDGEFHTDREDGKNPVLVPDLAIAEGRLFKRVP